MTCVTMSNPRQLLIGDLLVIQWDVLIDNIPHKVAWTPLDGRMRIAWHVSHTQWSRWVELGPEWSPQRTEVEAEEAAYKWAHSARWPGPHVN